MIASSPYELIDVCTGAVQYFHTVSQALPPSIGLPCLPTLGLVEAHSEWDGIRGPPLLCSNSTDRVRLAVTTINSLLLGPETS